MYSTEQPTFVSSGTFEPRGNIKPRLLDYCGRIYHREPPEHRKSSMNVRMNGMNGITDGVYPTERSYSSPSSHSSRYSSTENGDRESDSKENPFSNPIHANIGL